ncbi:N-acetylglucosamine-6-phosphate deacetylase [Gracilibacillus oryzae]|uniref:N-acetylglucosamine-6-phosphate deacetylase n=1 Tax=Gracilibacillus oryzae TaxID=1672701 RepID=A0A7C8GTX8_9BACI|nr:N-acetylglucosamine-6-phosphate deacetylase [Gracilibacillus oryzae]KAB8137808.1 N-acetylglucosamine-6-phosphate deacetylase [Gracilibacillus oryzae]
MSTTLIYNARIYTEEKVIEQGAILLKDGKIALISDQEISSAKVEHVINANGMKVIPGFIDGHIHGAYGVDVMDATPEALDMMATKLPSEGTTSFLATTITQSPDQIKKALHNIANYRNRSSVAEIIGIHLEGPFISKAKAGAQPHRYISPPDIDIFKEWQEDAQGLIKTITFAPELDKADKFMEYLSNQSVNMSAGHTDASFAQIKQAAESGVTQLTHLCNAMNGIHHRDIGAVGAAFMLDNMYAEVIADKVHLSEEMLQMVYQNIGSDRLLLITDAMRAKGLQNGTYDLGGQQVTVENNRAVLADGTLAGSTLKMIDAVKNIVELTNATMEGIIKMTSTNPAKRANVLMKKGSIKTGKDADILIVDDHWNIAYTICHGEIAYKG